ncbi:uncharacterized protein N7479_006917 [Penicillium vulpinum]|uniref:Pre-mRNA-splicing factor SPF27 n=1 Tax=Penicillium vulpinum TaxID=29845 RepID=A0A1V6S3C2_9EURO|nr:uncharacterized protein N7479_006917 [Penicillium vulpinum]KAJ5959767.1 hypothetical protein N7479_006917 [Penicillium vulpinum]OQE08356.1 hypothetical protein PENVUL_c010G07758 [Penicillium vulpinum]
MPLINESHDSLPYVDAAPTASARARAQQLINAELSPEHASTMHPWIPEAPEPKFSQLMQQELSRKAQGAPLTGGIDLSRYEAPEAPTRASDQTPDLEKWNETYKKACVSRMYLTKREENLALLEEHGKNAWLVHNSQNEEILGSTEKELAETKEASEEVNKQRKIAQEASQGEIVSLEETWKRGPEAILNVELASEALRMQNLDYRRQMAQQQAR